MKWAYRLLMGYAWLSVLYTYSPPKREAPQGVEELDTLGLLKVANRGLSLLFAVLLVPAVIGNPNFRRVFQRLAPYLAFALWCAVSTMWSPFPEKTFGKALGVLIGASIALCTGVICSEEKSWSELQRHLTVLCLSITALNFIAEIGTFGLGALERYRFRSDLARDGVLMHAGSIANICGLGLFLVLANALLFRRTWARRMLVLALPLCLVTLFFTNSRASTAATILGVTIVCTSALGLRYFFALSFLPAAAALLLLGLDPAQGSFDRAIEKAESHMLRGQSVEEVRSLSGRDDKWEMAWEGFENAVFAGGGYDVVAGFTDVFVNGRWQPLPVHNLYLFLLTGVGLIGITLFGWGLLAVMLPLLLRLIGRHRRWRQSVFLLAGLSMFLLVGVTEVIFVGGSGFSATVAYVFVGLAAAECVARRPRVAE